jgi:CheY-like chemotaxis protein
MLSPNPTVLYVEDDEGDRFFMERAFAAAGLGSTLRMVPDGEAALEYLSGQGGYANRAQFPLPHFILLDLNLPRVSGFELLEWLRGHPVLNALPVVIFSSSMRDEDRLRAERLGANDYWEKPNSGLQFDKIVTLLRERWLTPSTTAAVSAPKRLDKR